MAITVKAYAEHERLALVPTLRRADDLQITVLTQANTDPGSHLFPFWFEYEDVDKLERFLEDDPTVDDYELVDEGEDTHIYYIEHAERTKLLSPVVTQVNGFMSWAETKRRGWFLQLQLPDREALTTIWEYAEEYGVSFEIVEVYGRPRNETNVAYGLTEQQVEALTVAYECGYFSEPREMALSDVADEIGLSSTAMSGRLRRGMRNLISAALLDGEDID
ncbi:helix-turn-helix domain-containing protein [Natronococcus occultus]|uniref:Putative DNA binding protein n=1 Tax=Natronococcus occultus SP4 TaxID=694430 RepID=L0K010_9EURY|nr:helix-turn-helix domain-containing protein [Natronococcus occultus]AGB37694.1 putative DNA binding protein [Natronococcus occultus SP4]